MKNKTNTILSLLEFLPSEVPGIKDDANANQNTNRCFFKREVRKRELKKEKEMIDDYLKRFESLR